MRRLIVANLLVFAVLASAAALAYYGWSYTAEVSSRERALVEDTMRELAEEKIVNIESLLVDADKKLFEAIDIDRLSELKDVVNNLKSPVVSVFVLGPDLKELPSGTVSKRTGDALTFFKERFLTTIVPTLPLRQSPIGVRGHLHGIWDGEELLLAYQHRIDDGREYFIVLETDWKYLVGKVFPQFFDVESKRLFQVVDDQGQHIHGQPFTTTGPVVELPFVQTVDKWSLRVAQK